MAKVKTDRFETKGKVYFSVFCFSWATAFSVCAYVIKVMADTNAYEWEKIDPAYSLPNPIFINTSLLLLGLLAAGLMYESIALWTKNWPSVIKLFTEPK